MKKIIITQKDKIVLIILLCFLIIGGSIYYIYIPHIKKIKLLQKEILQINNNIHQQQELIKESTILPEQSIQLKSDLELLSQKLQGNFYTEQVEQKFTRLATNQGLDSQTISLSYSEEKLSGYNNKNNETLQEIPQYLIKHHVNVKNYLDFLNYIDELSNLDNVIIQELSILPNAQLVTQDNNHLTGDVSFIFYEWHN